MYGLVVRKLQISLIRGYLKEGERPVFAFQGLYSRSYTKMRLMSIDRKKIENEQTPAGEMHHGIV